MNQPGRDGFDAQVALTTSQARAEKQQDTPAPAGPPPRWRRPFAIVLRLAKPVLRPLLFRLRRYFTEPLRQDMLGLQQVMRQQFDQLQRHNDAMRENIIAAQVQGREEMRMIYTSLLDQIHATQASLTEAARLGEQASAAASLTHAEVHRIHAELLERASVTDQSMQQLLEQANAADRSVRQLLEQASAADRSMQQLLERTSAVDQSVQQLLAPLSDQLARVENYAYASARRVALPCGEGEMLVRTEAGYIVCSASDLSVLGTLVDSGDLERGTRLLIQSLLRPGDVFVDVGANIGMHTLAGGRAMAAQGTIIAFEPFEPTRRLLEKSIWINGLKPIVRIHDCAVSDQAGAHTLFLGASSGHHSLFTHGSEGVPALGQVEVRTVRLDDVIEPALRVNLLKIDAEGAELAVLAGAAATVRNSPDIALIVEFGPSHLHATGQNSAAWLAAFEAFGLQYRAIDELTGTVARRSLAELEAAESTNLFFARPGSAAWNNVKETV